MMKFLSVGLLQCALCVGFTACADKKAESPNLDPPVSEGQSGEINPESETTLTDAYYWAGGEKVPLERIEGKFMVMFYSENEAQIMDELAKAGAKVSYVEPASQNHAAQRGGAYTRATVECEFEKIESALALTFYWDHYYRQTDGHEAWTDGKFIVGLRSADEYSSLKKMAEENGVEIVRKNDRYETHYIACTNDSKGNAVEMANLFYESGLFEWASPNLAGMVHVD
jgi:hypothetical protein